MYGMIEMVAHGLHFGLDGSPSAGPNVGGHSQLLSQEWLDCGSQDRCGPRPG